MTVGAVTVINPLGFARFAPIVELVSAMTARCDDPLETVWIGRVAQWLREHTDPTERRALAAELADRACYLRGGGTRGPWNPDANAVRSLALTMSFIGAQSLILATNYAIHMTHGQGLAAINQLEQAHALGDAGLASFYAVLVFDLQTAHQYAHMGYGRCRFGHRQPGLN